MNLVRACIRCVTVMVQLNMYTENVSKNGRKYQKQHIVNYVKLHIISHGWTKRRKQDVPTVQRFFLDRIWNLISLYTGRIVARTETEETITTLPAVFYQLYLLLLSILFFSGFKNISKTYTSK